MNQSDINNDINYILKNNNDNDILIKLNKIYNEINNKFNIHFQKLKGNDLDLNIKNLEKDSFFSEKFSEDFTYKNNHDFNHNKFDNQEKPKDKIQGQFKSTAADFKIKYKTELCKYYEINGYCKYGERCAYAHGKENLRSKVTNTSAYRTKKCTQFFEHGYCPYGSRCQFAHQLTTNIINNPYDRKMSYKKTLETISKIENLENIKKLISKPRLSVFKEICDDKISIENSLLDDIKSIHKDKVLERININSL